MAKNGTGRSEIPADMPQCSDENPSPFDWMEVARQQLQSARLADDRRKWDRGCRDRRSAERLEIEANARLSLSMRQGFEGRLVDISIHGCSLEIGATVFCTGDVVWMKAGALQHWRGTVRWVDGTKVGIEFEQPFYPAVVDHLVQSNRKIICSRAA